jgi:hypothetical protein
MIWESFQIDVNLSKDSRFNKIFDHEILRQNRNYWIKICTAENLFNLHGFHIVLMVIKIESRSSSTGSL